MAEGWCKHLHGDTIEAFSAGIEKHGLNPFAVAVMREVGLDISSHHSKTLDDLAGRNFDVVVTVCGHANETCPVFPGKTRVVHHGFEDPPALAKDAASDEEALVHYRRVRDQIREFVQNLPDALRAVDSE